MNRIRAGLLTLGVFVLVLVLSRWQAPEGALEPSVAAAGQPVTMPGPLDSLTIALGLKDTKVTDWEGQISLSAGKIVGIDVVQGNPKATATTKGTFNVRTALAKMNAKKDNVTAPILRVTIDAPATARVNVKTNHGNFDFALGDLSTDKAKLFLDGAASVLRETGAIRLTNINYENDYPVLAKAPDGTLWLTYCEYTAGKPYITERVLAGNFDDLVPKGNGDKIRLKKFDGKTWSVPLEVTDGGLDIWRPSVTVANGRIHVSWAQQVAGNWDIYHRVYTPKDGDKGTWTDVTRVTTAPGTDFNVVSATAASGHVWLAWQTWDKGNFQIHARALDVKNDKVAFVTEELALTKDKANSWSPAIVANSKGKVFVAYDTYAKQNYDIRLVEVAAQGVGQTIDVAASARAEMRPSLACDKDDRIWISYEEGDEQWGKDFSTNMFRKIGFEENPGNALYISRTVRVKCLADGKVMQTAGNLQRAIGIRTANNRSMSRIGIDGQGNPWLFYRHHPKPLGAGEVWNSYATCYDGKEWSSPKRLVQSDNLMDNRPALAAAGNGLIAVYSGDGRTNQQTRKRNDLFATVLFASGPRQATDLAADETLPTKLKQVHPDEIADVARIRAYRFEHEGKKLNLFRGEFHRHTEYTAHRDGDGLLEDSWRYALDAGNLDWMGNADHDNGHHDEYSWWQIQKTADLMHNAPTFVAIQSYERSVVYPNGHRNVIMPKRGIRPMPRGNLAGTEEGGTPDTKILYKYLKHFGAMCSSHTSGTNMGTDWRDNDPEVEPVVEVYQGHRHNYEHFGAPRSATEKTNIGGYEPKGFIWNAFGKGYKLGFQASSDHISTHMSYGMVLTDDLSRQGIIDAFKRRHSYAATDNIIVEFRCGKQIMGDIFTTDKSPTFEIKVLGTAPVTKVSIVRDAKYIKVVEPKAKDVKFQFTDPEPNTGKASYYYVRVEQADANLAWASPMWITVKK